MQPDNKTNIRLEKAKALVAALEAGRDTDAEHLISDLAKLHVFQLVAFSPFIFPDVSIIYKSQAWA